MNRGIASLSSSSALPLTKDIRGRRQQDKELVKLKVVIKKENKVPNNNRNTVIQGKEEGE